MFCFTLLLALLLVVGRWNHVMANEPTASPTSIKPTTAPTRTPTIRPTGPTRKPTRRPTARPTGAKKVYVTTDYEKRFNIAFASVIGALSFIVWVVLTYYKMQQEYIWHNRRDFVKRRGAMVREYLSSLTSSPTEVAISVEKQI